MSVERLAELVRERQPCVVLTGAGISTESRSGSRSCRGRMCEFAAGYNKTV